jgi:DNA-binding transcriptional regulator YiaG
VKLITSVVLSPMERRALRAARRASGLTAKIVAHQAGCTVSRLYSWEAGARHPSGDAFSRWCVVLSDALDEAEKKRVTTLHQVA